MYCTVGAKSLERRKKFKAVFQIPPFFSPGRDYGVRVGDKTNNELIELWNE